MYFSKDTNEIILLLFRYDSCSTKWRVAKNELKIPRRNNVFPRGGKGVSAHNRGRMLQGNGRKYPPQGLAELHIHNMFHEPHGNASYFRWKFLDFNPAKLVNAYFGNERDI